MNRSVDNSTSTSPHPSQAKRPAHPPPDQPANRPTNASRQSTDRAPYSRSKRSSSSNSGGGRKRRRLPVCVRAFLLHASNLKQAVHHGLGQNKKPASPPGPARRPSQEARRSQALASREEREMLVLTRRWAIERWKVGRADLSGAEHHHHHQPETRTTDKKVKPPESRGRHRQRTRQKDPKDHAKYYTLACSNFFSNHLSNDIR
ncbi:hypothetical protein IWZ01DRAFT_299953 [Phyllosticta capitalensis]